MTARFLILDSKTSDGTGLASGGLRSNYELVLLSSLTVTDKGPLPAKAGAGHILTSLSLPKRDKAVGVSRRTPRKTRVKFLVEPGLCAE
jgi:hypothetical protein